MNMIIVSDAHKMPAPLVYHLGEHTLIITSDYGAPDAFELVAPSVHETPEGECAQSAEPGQETAILDHEEAYRLHQCLHMLFVTPGCESSD